LKTFGDKFGNQRGSYGKGYPVQQLPTTQTARYKDFSGGYYAGDSDEDVPQNSTPGGTDVEVTRKDRIIRAPGTAAFEALVGHSPEQLAIHAGLGYRSELVLFDLPFIGFKREGATTWVNAALVPGDPVTDMYFYATFGDDFIFQNGAQHVYKHTFGTDTVEIVDAIPLGHTMAVFAGRLWVGGGLIDGNFEPLGIDWSGVNGYDDRDIDNGAGTELLIQDTGLGDRLVALRPMGFDYMAAMCRRSIWVIRRVDDFTRPGDPVPRVTGKGCVHERTAKTTFGGVIYLSDEGVELFDGNDSIHLSAAIDPEIIPLDFANIHKYSASFNPQSQRYTLVVPGKGVYVYDVLRKRWFKRTQLAIDVVPFATQFHAVTWAELVGAWDAQIATWKAFSPNEIDTPDTVFLGQKVDTSFHIEKENAASITYFDRPQVPLWIFPLTEQEKGTGLITTQEIRATYVGVGTLGYQLKNNDGDLTHVGQANLPVVAAASAPKTKTMNCTFTGKGVGLAIEVGGSLELAKMEMDFRLRGKRIGDGIIDTGPPVILPDQGLRDVLMWGRPIRGAVMTDYIGNQFEGSTVNGAGSNTAGWQAPLMRYGHRTFGFAGSTVWKAQTGLLANLLVDPSTGVIPVIIRVRDVIQFTVHAGALGGGFFGFCPDVSNNGTLVFAVSRCVGFANINGNWHSRYTANNGGVLRDVDSLITVSGIHELMFELDGVKKQVRWYIDGVLFDTYQVVADATAVVAGEQTSPVSLHHYAGGPATNASMYHGLGIGPLVEVQRSS